MVPPDRALPVELQVAQPARVDQQRRTRTLDGVRNPDAVGRPAKRLVSSTGVAIEDITHLGRQHADDREGLSQ